MAPTFLVSDAVESGRLKPVLRDYALTGSRYLRRAAARFLSAWKGAGLDRDTPRAFRRRSGLGPLLHAYEASQLAYKHDSQVLALYASGWRDRRRGSSLHFTHTVTVIASLPLA